MYVYEVPVPTVTPFTFHCCVKGAVPPVIVRLYVYELPTQRPVKVPVMAAKILSSLITFMFNYITNKIFIFKKAKLL